MMLGTNDVLSDCNGANAAIAMRGYLSFLSGYLDPSHILVVAPVPAAGIGVPSTYTDQCRAYNHLLASLSASLGMVFADADDWGIVLTQDGVHFSPGGHATFAQRIGEQIKSLWGA